MENRTYIVLICAILFTSYSIGCDCALKKLAELQKSSYESSDCIFIGNIIQINNPDNSFEIKVVESLDGGDETYTLLSKYLLVIFLRKSKECGLFTQIQMRVVL